MPVHHFGVPVSFSEPTDMAWRMFAAISRRVGNSCGSQEPLILIRHCSVLQVIVARPMGYSTAAPDLCPHVCLSCPRTPASIASTTLVEGIAHSRKLLRLEAHLMSLPQAAQAAHWVSGADDNAASATPTPCRAVPAIPPSLARL